MKIIIIGAGTAGLTTAYACLNAGMDVTIYEKAKQLQNIGGGVLLWPHALRYLEWLGLGDCLKPFRVDIKGCAVIGSHGKQIFAEDYAHLYSLIGGEILPIDRSLLQQTLLKKIPSERLRLNKTCVDIEVHAEHTRVVFADGSKDQADIVIGADGIHSVVRKSFNKGVELEYTDQCWWGGIVEQKYVPSLPSDKVYMALGLCKMCIVWPTHDGRFMWYLPVKMPKESLRGDAQSQITEICADWHPEVRQIISAPQNGRGFHLPIHAIPPQASWAQQRIVLVGDAAHAIGPILGQGTNLAIEDAYVLSESLKRNGDDYLNAFVDYMLLRQMKTKQFYLLEKLSAMTMVNDDLDALEAFQQTIQQLNLATFYQDIIPLVNEQSCLNLAKALSGTDIIAEAVNQ